VSSSPQRERAEAAFGHLQQAAGEMIAAAHDALGMVEEAVSTAGLNDILDAVDHLSRSVFSWARPRGHRPPTAPPNGDPGSEPGRDPGHRRRPPPGDGPVERIPVR
jgi:hypothetical protein